MKSGRHLGRSLRRWGEKGCPSVSYGQQEKTAGWEFTLACRFTAQFDLANAKHDSTELGLLLCAVGRKPFPYTTLSGSLISYGYSSPLSVFIPEIWKQGRSWPKGEMLWGNQINPSGFPDRRVFHGTLTCSQGKTTVMPGSQGSSNALALLHASVELITALLRAWTHSRLSLPRERDTLPFHVSMLFIYILYMCVDNI